MSVATKNKINAQFNIKCQCLLIIMEDDFVLDGDSCEFDILDIVSLTNASNSLSSSSLTNLSNSCSHSVGTMYPFGSISFTPLQDIYKSFTFGINILVQHTTNSPSTTIFINLCSTKNGTFNTFYRFHFSLKPEKKLGESCAKAIKQYFHTFWLF